MWVCGYKIRFTYILNTIIPYCVWMNFVATYCCCFPSSFYNCWSHADNNTCLELPTKIANLLMGCKCLSDKKNSIINSDERTQDTSHNVEETMKFLLSKIYFLIFIQWSRLHVISLWLLEVSFISRKIIYLIIDGGDYVYHFIFIRIIPNLL